MRPSMLATESTIDRRTYLAEASNMQVRQLDGGDMSLVGYAVNYNRRSELLYGMFYEEIVRGAFDGSCANDDIRAFWSHDSSLVLGRTKSGTLKCSSDEIGVRFEVNPPKTPFTEHCMESMRRGDVDQMSFGFYTESESDDEWSQLPDGTYLRKVHRAKLVEVSPVAIPAYTSTTVVLASRTLRGLETQRSIRAGIHKRSITDWDWRIRMASAKFLGRNPR